MVQKKVFRWALPEPIISSQGLTLRQWTERFKAEHKRDPTPEELEALGVKKDDSTIDILKTALDKLATEKGFETFMTLKRIAEAIEKADAKDTIDLEAKDLAKLQEILKENMPAIWALNKNIREAIEDFLEVKK